MTARQSCILLGIYHLYMQVVLEVGEEHRCSQGCGERGCKEYQERHDIEIMEMVGNLLKENRR